MTNKPSRYTITSALPYANGPVHIGHLAGVYVPADIYARFLRSKGENVLFIGGSDEHGVPITIRAKKEGVTPQQIVDKYHIQIKQSFEELGISFDIYSRTSSKIHAETSSELFEKIYTDPGFVSEQENEQLYDPEAKQFLADRYVIGTCPKCGNENAYGDQCEKCGSTLSPYELINPRSTLSGATPINKRTKHWYLRLDKHQEVLTNWINSKTNWKTNVLGQCKSWLNQILLPRAITRDLDWGVPVPVAGAEGKVLYVWFDAPIGYISATKDYFLNSKIKTTHKNNTWEDFWKESENEERKLIHFIGKDNIVFHCIIFPTMLDAFNDHLSDGESPYILPNNVPANEFMNLEGDKISTSRNWAVWLHEYLEEFKDKQDVLRYALCANAPETKDNDFTWRDFQARNNNELVAIYGNFVNRALVLTHKYYDGVIPALGALEANDEAVIMMLKEFPGKIAASIEAYRFREALGFMMDLARLGNKYLADTEPWKIYKENPERVKTILHIGLQIAANLAIVSEPFIPFTSAKLFSMMNLNANTWNNAGTIDLLKAGDKINPAELLFEKIEDATIELQVKKLEDTKQANLLANAEVKPLKENVSFEDFSKMDIRVATIIAAEKVAKTKKLLKLTLQTGIDERTVVSGIAEHFDPEKIIGQQVSLLANLAPREIKGIVSQGMILMAEDADGSLKFVQPAGVVNAGSMIG